MRKYIEKYTKVREKNLKYDFLPSMLEIIEKPENRMAEVIIILITSMLVVTILWASLFKVDIAVTAYGSLNAEGNVIPVNNEYAGIVSEICVEDGDYVEVGDVLLILDVKKETAELQQLETDLTILEIQKEMYEKIYHEEDLAEFDTFVYGEHATIAEAICREQTLYLLQIEQYDIVRDTTDDKKLLDNQKENFRMERELTVVQTLNTISERIREKEAELEAIQNLIANRKIVATTSGVISNIQINTTGYYLSSNQIIAYIIPSEEDIIFKAYVQNSDIEAIGVGDRVNVKLASLDNTEYEIIVGEVREIGTLAVSVDGLGNVYPIDVALQEVPQELLHIGSEGNCDIIAGQRTVSEYFLQPFMKGMEDSLKER